MRDKQLASIATQLVDTATEIAESIESGHHMRETLLRETRNKQRCARVEVPTEVLDTAGRGFREHVERQLGSLIVHEAIKNIDFEVETEKTDKYLFYRKTTRFTAKAYVLTQRELTKLVDDAIEIGRHS